MVLLVCGALHADLVAEKLNQGNALEADLWHLGRRPPPLWPLLISAYLLVPGFFTWYMFSKMMPDLTIHDNNSGYNYGRLVEAPAQAATAGRRR